MYSLLYCTYGGHLYLETCLLQHAVGISPCCAECYALPLVIVGKVAARHVRSIQSTLL